ncbi:hypothetical protein WA577_002067, partial [Blastocystis sp. JDR]
MSNQPTSNPRSGYISSLLVQRIHELVSSILVSPTPSSTKELESIMDRYNTAATKLVVREVLSALLSSQKQVLATIDKKNLFLSGLFKELLLSVDGEYILRSALTDLQLKSTSLSYPSFLSYLQLDSVSCCVLSLLLTNIDCQPFGDSVTQCLKDTIPKLVNCESSDILDLYLNDILSFVKSHSALWGQEKQRALLQSLLARDTDSMAGLSILYNPCPSRGSSSSAHHHVLTPSQLAAPIAVAPSLFLVTDL